MRFRGAAAVVTIALIACTANAPKPATTAKARPKWMRDAARVAQPSRAVEGLLKDDPDLKRQMSPAEIKAALEAAQSDSPAQPQGATTATAGDGGDWQKLEKDQQARNDAYKDRLAQTTVYVAPGSLTYHNAGCPELYRYQFINGSMEAFRVFVGTPISLATAKDRGMQPHSACGAPGYDFRYQ